MTQNSPPLLLIVAALVLLGTSELSNGMFDLETCGFAPLCGDSDIGFDWSSSALEGQTAIAPGEFITGAVIDIDGCCSLKDTIPQHSCQILNPSGEHTRSLTSHHPICGLNNAGCLITESECDSYILAIEPRYPVEDYGQPCCNSCSCFSDPECISFSGNKNTWIVCDGREQNDLESDTCRVTEEICVQQIDPAGNHCVFLPPNDDYNITKHGSPCAQSPESPATITTMYSAPMSSFEVRIEHGAGGFITKIYLNLNSGDFSLEAAECLTSSLIQDAWNLPSTLSSLPEFFAYDFSETFRNNVLWSVIDPTSGIALSIRCIANSFDDDANLYLPRMNIEQLSDPNKSRANSTGYCVTSHFDTGLGSTDNTEQIEENGLCSGDKPENLEIFRAICRNPGLSPVSIDLCIYLFCAANHYPLMNSISECQIGFRNSIAETFCKAMTFTNYDWDACYWDWQENGALAIIEQYLYFGQGCTTQWQTSLEPCQSGFVIQQFYNGTWEDAVAIPSDYCNYNSHPILLSYCNYPHLFRNPIKVTQKAASFACGPTNQCVTVDGFKALITLSHVTSAPTNNPTYFPSSSPTKYPSKVSTNFPSSFPTVSPSKFPTLSPSTLPTVSPTSSPTNVPTVSPTQYPTSSPSTSPTSFPTTSPTNFPSTSPTHFPTISPSNFPTHFPTISPSNFPTHFPTISPSNFPTNFPTESPTSFPTNFPTSSPTHFPTSFPTNSP